MRMQNQTPFRVLLLGGTSEASQLAACLAADDRFDGVLSLAGRTANPAASALRTRTGGFGGADGMAAFIRDRRIGAVVDATHPFAAQISANAIAACASAGCPLFALERLAWLPEVGDRWSHFSTVAKAVAALPERPSVVFSGLGRLSLVDLEAAPHHRYVIRLIDPPPGPLALPHATLIMGRGPFRTDDDVRLFREHGVEFVLAKNAGGDAAVSKIEAARALDLQVMMIDRPAIPPRPVFQGVDTLWGELVGHVASRTNRGV